MVSSKSSYPTDLGASEASSWGGLLGGFGFLAFSSLSSACLLLSLIPVAWETTGCCLGDNRGVAWETTIRHRCCLGDNGFLCSVGAGSQPILEDPFALFVSSADEVTTVNKPTDLGTDECDGFFGFKGEPSVRCEAPLPRKGEGPHDLQDVLSCRGEVSVKETLKKWVTKIELLWICAFFVSRM